MSSAEETWDATHVAEVIQSHQPYTPTLGGYGCLSCEVEFPDWDAFAGHLARAVDRAQPAN